MELQQPPGGQQPPAQQQPPRQPRYPWKTGLGTWCRSMKAMETGSIVNVAAKAHYVCCREDIIFTDGPGTNTGLLCTKTGVSHAFFEGKNETTQWKKKEKGFRTEQTGGLQIHKCKILEIIIFEEKCRTIIGVTRNQFLPCHLPTDNSEDDRPSGLDKIYTNLHTERRQALSCQRTYSVCTILHLKPESSPRINCIHCGW